MALSDAPSSARKALAVVLFTVFLDLLGFGMIIPILPLYARKLHATVPQVGWLMAIYSIMQLVFAPLWGRLSDRVGRRPVLLVSICGSALSQLGYALAGSFPLLVLSRGLAGVCGANIGAAQAYIADVTDVRSRASAMGLLGAAFGLGFVFGPVFGGELSHISDTAPFFGAAALAAVNFVLALVLLREPAQHRQRRTPLTRAELRRVLGEPELLALLGVVLIVTFGFANMEGVIALLCKERFGFHERDVGHLFALVGVVVVVVQGGLVRRLVPRFGEPRLILAGLTLMGLGLLGIGLSRALWQLLLATACMSAGSGLNNPSLSALVSRRAGAHQGTVLGVSQAMAALGRILGPLAGTWTFTRGTGVPFYTGAACMGGALLLALARVPRERPAAKAE